MPSKSCHAVEFRNPDARIDFPRLISRPRLKVVLGHISGPVVMALGPFSSYGYIIDVMLSQNSQ